MALSRIWSFLIASSFVLGLYKRLFLGDEVVFQKMAGAVTEAAKTGFEVSIGLVGVMALWLGVMNLGEKAGLIQGLARLLSPFLGKIFPDIPKGHPALGAIIMNFSANMLGLDSAATPLGLEAMRELQTLNPSSDRASNAQIMFTAINTAGLTLIPVSVMTIRAQQGAANPADVFIPALLGTLVSAFSAIILVGAIQRVNFFRAAVLLPLVGMVALLGAILYLFAGAAQESIGRVSQFAGNFLVVAIITGFVVAAWVKRVNVYEAFVEGAKQGFETGVRIIPFLVAMLLAIFLFRASGFLDYVLAALTWVFQVFGINTEFVPALPTALMKPLSGSGARGLMIDTLKQYGPDSFIGKLVCTVQGSTETTFYVLALYYGSVAIKDTRYTLWVGLVVDLIGVIAAILLGYVFFR
jgi:spore maturation protein SpmA